MRIYADIWRLPGPGGFVQEVARLALGGQHVLAVVPKFIADNPEYADALTVAIANELGESRRVLPSPSQGGLARAFGFEVADDFDSFPTTVPELISHVDVVGRTFLCNAGDLDPAHVAELPNFLKRLDDESRPIPKADRGTIVFVLNRDLLPQDAESVATVRLWYWDRVARWDVAALLASQVAWNESNVVLAGVRLETIIEIARWDLMFALKVVREWTNDEAELLTLLDLHTVEDFASTEIRRTARKQPPEHHLETWDQGLVEAWHGELGYNPAAMPRSDGTLERLIWSAQARVLLPWIEIRRVRVERIVREKLGATRMDAAVIEFTNRLPGVGEDSPVVEIATLSRIISARFGGTEPRLHMTAHVLKRARNRLAHLSALPQNDLERLVVECDWLDH